jgi:hypothetical protein
MDFARKLMPENLCGLLATPAETESSSQAARLSPESGLRSEAVKNLIHNSKFDTRLGRGALRSIHTHFNYARQMLPAPTRKGGDTCLHVLIRCPNENQHHGLKRTEKKEVNF